MKKILLAVAVVFLSCAAIAQTGTTVVGANGTKYFQLGISSSQALSPAAATVYYAGLYTSPNTTATNVAPFPSPVACKVTAITYLLFVTGTADTTLNNFTFKLYNLTTTTALADTSASLSANATRIHAITVSGASDSIAAGDQLLLQITSPASFGTPPTAITFAATVACQ